MVYVEYVIVNNLLANFFIFVGTSKVSGIVLTKKRLIFTTVIGTVFGVLFPTIKITEIFCFVIKFISALFLTFIMTGRTGLKKYLISLFVFYCVSFCLGGAVLGLLNGLSFNLAKNYTEEQLTFCILAGGIIFIYIAKQVLSYIISRVDKGCVTVYLESIQKQTLALEGFVDSGNEVFFDGVGVSFIPFEYKDKINYQKTENFISVKTTVGSKIFQIYKLPYLRFSDGRKEEIDVPVAFWKSDKKQNRVILHSKRS